MLSKLTRYKNQFFELLLGYRFYILAFVVLGISLDIFLFSTGSIAILLSVIWALIAVLCGFEGRVSIVGALLLLIICSFLLAFGKEDVADRAAVWAYILLVIGVIQQFLGYLKMRED